MRCSAWSAGTAPGSRPAEGPPRDRHADGGRWRFADESGAARGRTGFHPELTGRENIYLNGAILGMKRREIDERFDAIVEFSGVEKFMDTPVKRY